MCSILPLNIHICVFSGSCCRDVFFLHLHIHTPDQAGGTLETLCPRCQLSQGGNKCTSQFIKHPILTNEMAIFELYLASHHALNYIWGDVLKHIILFLLVGRMWHVQIRDAPPCADVFTFIHATEHHSYVTIKTCHSLAANLHTFEKMFCMLWLGSVVHH